MRTLFSLFTIIVYVLSACVTPAYAQGLSAATLSASLVEKDVVDETLTGALDAGSDAFQMPDGYKTKFPLPFPQYNSFRGLQEPEWLESSIVAQVLLRLVSEYPDGIPIDAILEQAVSRFKDFDLHENKDKVVVWLEGLRRRGLVSGRDQYRIKDSIEEKVTLAVPARLLALWSDDAAYILEDIKKTLAEKTDTALHELLKTYAEYSTVWSQIPLESCYPVLRAVTMLSQEEQEMIRQYIVDHPTLRADVLVDSICLMFASDERKQEWLKQQAPDLVGRRVYSLSTEISLYASGRSRVVNHQVSAMRAMGVDTTIIEPYYPYTYNEGELEDLDYTTLEHPLSDIELVSDQLETIVQGAKVKFSVYKALNEEGVPVYLIRDAEKKYVKVLYRYRGNRQDRGEYDYPSEYEFAEFFSKASAELVKYLEAKERSVFQIKKYKAPVIDAHGSHALPIHAWIRLFYSDHAFSKGLLTGATHTYSNRLLTNDFEFGKEYLRRAGVPNDAMWLFLRHNHLGEQLWDMTSGGLRASDVPTGVSAIHAHEMNARDPGVNLRSIMRGDVRTESGRYFRDALDSVGADDVERPSADDVRRAKRLAKKSIGFNPEQMVVSYSGALSTRKFGVTRACTRENIEALLARGVTVAIYGMQLPTHESYELVTQLQAWEKEFAAKNFPGTFVLQVGFTLDEQRKLLAATDVQVHDPDRYTGAAEFSEADVCANAGLQMAPPYWEGMTQKQGVPINRQTLRGNTLVPADADPQSYLEKLIWVADLFDQRELSVLQERSYQLSRVNDASLSVAATLRVWQDAIVDTESSTLSRRITGEVSSSDMVMDLKTEPGHMAMSRMHDNGFRFFISEEAHEWGHLVLEIDVNLSRYDEATDSWFGDVPFDAISGVLVNDYGVSIPVKRVRRDGNRGIVEVAIPADMPFPFYGSLELTSGLWIERVPVEIVIGKGVARDLTPDDIRARVSEMIDDARNEGKFTISMVAMEKPLFDKNGKRFMHKGGKQGGQSVYMRELRHAISQRNIRSVVARPLFAADIEHNYADFEEFLDAMNASVFGTVQVPIGNGSIPIKLIYLEQENGPVFLLYDESKNIFRDLYADPSPDSLGGYLEVIVLSRIGLLLQDALGVQFDLFHCNDWQTAMMPAYLKQRYADREWINGRRPGVVFTTHNLEYQGNFPFDMSMEMKWSKELMNYLIQNGVLSEHRYMDDPDGNYYYTDGGSHVTVELAKLSQLNIETLYSDFESYTRHNVMKGAFKWSDKIVFVSEGHMEEVITPARGFGLADVLEDLYRAGRLAAVYNGVRSSNHRPENLLKVLSEEEGFSPEVGDDVLEWVDASKEALQKKLGLEVNPNHIMLGIVGRIVKQKGHEILFTPMDAFGGITFLEAILKISHPETGGKVQVVFLGQGGDQYGVDLENQLVAFAHDHPEYADQLSVTIGFDYPLSKQIGAASLLGFMPSVDEPGGIWNLETVLLKTFLMVTNRGGLRDFYRHGGTPIKPFDGFELSDMDKRKEVSWHMYKTMEYYLGLYHRDPEEVEQQLKKLDEFNPDWSTRSGQYENIYRGIIDSIPITSVTKHAPTPHERESIVEFLANVYGYMFDAELFGFEQDKADLVKAFGKFTPRVLYNVMPIDGLSYDRVEYILNDARNVDIVYSAMAEYFEIKAQRMKKSDPTLKNMRDLFASRTDKELQPLLCFSTVFGMPLIEPTHEIAYSQIQRLRTELDEFFGDAGRKIATDSTMHITAIGGREYPAVWHDKKVTPEETVHAFTEQIAFATTQGFWDDMVVFFKEFGPVEVDIDGLAISADGHIILKSHPVDDAFANFRAGMRAIALKHNPALSEDDLSQVLPEIYHTTFWKLDSPVTPEQVAAFNEKFSEWHIASVPLERFTLLINTERNGNLYVDKVALKLGEDNRHVVEQFVLHPKNRESMDELLIEGLTDAIKALKVKARARTPLAKAAASIKGTKKRLKSA